ncbi:MAG: chromophore lyase CpcT/CpeT [Bryobacteraceae bacterium]|nr:chromophore lyase CpcT/CpeT [Bryobacteraceae bacterium]
MLSPLLLLFALADDPLTAVTEWLPGMYDTFEHAAQDEARATAYRHVRAVLKIVRLPEMAGKPAFYLEQAMAGAEAQPYRQRVLMLEQTGAGAVTVWDYRIAEPKDLVGGATEQLKALTMERLSREGGCEMVFIRADREIFKGSAGAGRSCKSSLRGATHVISYSELTPRTLTSLDQGFDDTGAHKWGPPPGVIGHIFRKRN